MSDKHLLIGLTVASSLLAYKLYKDKHESKLVLPPSPNWYPFVGHLLSVPRDYEYLGFMQLGEQLKSKMFSLSVFGTTIVVLNDKDDAVNLLEKRSAIYSDRTCPPMVQDSSLLDWGDGANIIGYGDQWRRYRRLMNLGLTKKAVATHHESQEQATRNLTQRLLKNHKMIGSSHKLEEEILLSISATLFRSLYGYEVQSSNDPLATRAHNLVSYLTYALLSSNYLVNIVPALRHIPDWCPGTGWKREASKWRKEKEALIDELYNIGLRNMNKAGNTHLMIASFHREVSKLGLTEEQVDHDVKQALIALLGGGIETTVNALMMFVMAMVMYPEVQEKAQAEIDEVIGDTRLPTFEDRPRLAYIERTLQETLRWRPIGPLAIPHTCFQEDTYKGYRIPQGAVVIGNVWAITRDESIYKDPEVFNPDRFLDTSTPLPPAFGWGRRACPGGHFAQSSLFITIASLLMTFNIGVGQDKSGKDCPPSGKVTNSLVPAPEGFKLTLTPRSVKHEELIRGSD